LEEVRAAIRARHYSIRTEESYLFWVRCFFLFHGKRYPRECRCRSPAVILCSPALIRRSPAMIFHTPAVILCSIAMILRSAGLVLQFGACRQLYPSVRTFIRSVPTIPGRAADV
jgi:hypothetical protein